MREFELVLPAYNEAKSLPTLINRVVEAATAAGYDAQRFGLVVVENGSRDNSAAVLGELQATPLGAWFSVVAVPVNQGYGYGLWQGLQATRAPYVGWSHADLQCDPADAFTALALVRAAPKRLVKGVRHGRNWKDQSVSRVFAGFAQALLGLSLSEINAQPKVFSRELLATFIAPPSTFAFDLYALYHAAKAGYEIKTIDVQFPPRVHGLSNWAATFAGRYKTIWGMIRYMWELQGREGRL